MLEFNIVMVRNLEPKSKEPDSTHPGNAHTPHKPGQP